MMQSTLQLGLWNCNLLACICVLFSTDRRWSPQVIKKALKYAEIGIARLTFLSGSSALRANVVVVVDGESEQ